MNIMDAATAKHYKFINSKTGYVIYYHTLKGDLSAGEIKIKLEKIKSMVAVDNSLSADTIYWEEIKDEK